MVNFQQRVRGEVAEVPQQQPTPTTPKPKPTCAEISDLGYGCMPRHRCEAAKKSAKLVRTSAAVELDPSTRWGPTAGDICCLKKIDPVSSASKMGSLGKTGLMSTLCPSDFTGVVAYLYDCGKFANCWKGKPTIQSCGPGTQFNAKLGQCDYPHKANCKATSKPQAQMSAAQKGNRQLFADFAHSNKIIKAFNVLGRIIAVERSP